MRARPRSPAPWKVSATSGRPDVARTSSRAGPPDVGVGVGAADGAGDGVRRARAAAAPGTRGTPQAAAPQAAAAAGTAARKPLRVKLPNRHGAGPYTSR